MAQKPFFLEENPKIPVISKFQVEFKTTKELSLERGRSEKWNESKCKIYLVKIKEILFAKG